MGKEGKEKEGRKRKRKGREEERDLAPPPEKKSCSGAATVDKPGLYVVMRCLCVSDCVSVCLSRS